MAVTEVAVPDAVIVRRLAVVECSRRGSWVDVLPRWCRPGESPLYRIAGALVVLGALLIGAACSLVWRYVYRAVDQHGQVIDVLLWTRRDAKAAGRFFTRTLRTLKVVPNEVLTDAAPVYPGVLGELIPTAWHHVEQYANNPVEADDGQLKRRLRPMQGLQSDRTAQVVIAGHAFVQNLRRSHYELAVDAVPALRVAAALTGTRPSDLTPTRDGPERVH